MLVATDGGLSKTTDNGFSWTSLNNFPITQLYSVQYRTNSTTSSPYYGGAQDNGTLNGDSGNSWYRAYGGDGFKPQFDPLDQYTWFTETQNGFIYQTTDDGTSFNTVFNPNGETTNWETPYFINKQNNYELIVGTTKVKKVDIWSTGSTDISPMLGDSTTSTNPYFYTISSLTQSATFSNMYAGTGDGNVWISTDNGTTWSKRNATLPKRYVSSIEGGHANNLTFFVAFSGYRDGDSTAQIYRTTDNGISYTNIGANLPKFAINDIVVAPNTGDSTILISNDGGVYVTTNAGLSWSRIGNNMPIMPVYDIEINKAANVLIAGTFAKGFMTYNLDSVLAIPQNPIYTNIGNSPVLPYLTLYPNPCISHFYIDKLSAEFQQYSITNYLGQNIQNGAIKNGEPIDVQSLPIGNYAITFTGVHGGATKKFVKM
jgi:photosystem II stability/assembly factor-like uncharacterized protein